MYNKLSFLSTDSLYPVCLALDDFEDSELVGQQVPMINDIITNTHDYIGYMVMLEKMCTGALSEKEEKELYSLLDELDKQGIRFGITNLVYHKGQKNEIFEKWSKKYFTYEITSNYISFNDNTIKGGSKEVFVTNYDNRNES